MTKKRTDFCALYSSIGILSLPIYRDVMLFQTFSVKSLDLFCS